MFSYFKSVIIDVSLSNLRDAGDEVLGGMVEVCEITVDYVNECRKYYLNETMHEFWRKYEGLTQRKKS